jgi:tRNA dimethylallyltransferase
VSAGTVIESEKKSGLAAGRRVPLEQKKTVENKTKKKQVIFLAGTTGAGKTSLSLILAKAIGGEIISADSMQVYRGMDIGTAKVTREEQALVPHHLIDIRDISEQFNIVDFYYEASKSCEAIHARNRIPIIVGGSGFYLRSLLYGPPSGPPSIPEVRRSLEEKVGMLGPEALYECLKARDPDYAATISKHDQQKIVRALEIITLTGDKVSNFCWASRELSSAYDFRCWFLYRPRESLYSRVEKRCDQMLEQGLIEEVAGLEQKGLKSNLSACQAIGYRQTLDFLATERSEDDYEDFVRGFKIASRRYVKRQFTWFRKETIFRWLNLDLHSPEATIEMITQDYLS